MAEEIILSCDLNRDFLARGGKNERIILRLSLYTHPDFVKAHPKTSCDVVFVVDTSSSMNESFVAGAKVTKREGVIQSMEAILPGVQTDDTISLICYDSATYMELDHAAGRDKDRIRAALPQIRKHCGATNFEKAFATTRKILESGHNASRRVCFLTDGNSTEGSLAKAHQLNREVAATGATVDCLGVGEDFNFQEMQRFTTVSSGETRILSTPAEAGTVFAQLLKAAQRSLVGNAVLRLSLPAGMRDVEIYQLTPEIRFFDDVKPARNGSVNYRINLQALAQTHNYIYLAQMGVDVPTDPDRANLPLARMRLDYDVPVLGLRGQVLENEIVLNLAGSPEQKESPNNDVDAAMLEASLEKLDQQAQRAAKQEDWRGVAILLHQMAQNARAVPDQEKAREYERRLDTLKKNGKLTQDDLNQIGRNSTRSARLRGGEREADNRKAY